MILRWYKKVFVRMAGKYHIGRYGGLIWKNWFSRILDAQAEIRLVRAKASKRLGSDQLESNNGHNHVERQSNIELGMKVI